MLKKDFSIPPKVKSRKTFGFCDLVIGKICWRTHKTFTDVRLNIQFWGENQPRSVKVASASANEIIRYQIRTSSRLLKEYLSCEPINIEVFSVKTNLPIGICRASIPATLLTDSNFESGIDYKTKLQILSKQGQLGLLELRIKIHFLISKKPQEAMPAKTEKPRFDTTPYKGVNKENISTKQAVIEHKSEVIDLIKISVSKMELNCRGIIALKHFYGTNLNVMDRKFMMKCVITSKIFKSTGECKIISNFSDMKGIVCDSEIIKSIHHIRDPESFLNFGFCIKHMDKETFIIGFARFGIQEILECGYSFSGELSIISEKNNIVGICAVKLELGSRNISFGKRMFDFISNSGNILSKQNHNGKSHPSNSNDNCDKGNTHDGPKSDDKSCNEGKSAQISKSQLTSGKKGSEIVGIKSQNNNISSKVFVGLLFIENLHNVRDPSLSDFFITYNGFWNECQETTELSTNLVFNHLKQFAIICDDAFLQRVTNNYLELKLWEKNNRNIEKLVGSANIPLHQFSIAFRNDVMIEHLSSTNKLPVISIDNFCHFVSPLNREPFCEGKILLAIGTANQIEFLKNTRHLNGLQKSLGSDVEMGQVKNQLPDTQLKNKLTAFLESLSQKQPESSNTSNSSSGFQASSAPMPSCGSNLQLRKTSDLLDTLQKALSQPPLKPETQINSTCTNHTENLIRIHISVDEAIHLPKVAIRKKQNRRKSKSNNPSTKTEHEPSVYVYATFEGHIDELKSLSDDDIIVKSHEGLVYCTTIQKGCNPLWNQQFDVHIPMDTIRNPEKRFVIKVWRKAGQDNSTRTPFQDAVVGFAAIDLSVLLTGLPVLSGWYNIVDFSGKCNGQIKMAFQPLNDNLLGHQIPVPLSAQNSSKSPLSVDVNDDESSLLSRTLKRKFDELDEITQRLRARLYDVTNDDPDEEFEKDLNTEVDESEESFSNDELGDFGWLKNNQQTVSAPSSFLPVNEILKNFDLDTLINPNILLNILDPKIAESDSTPSHESNLQRSGADDEDTTSASIMSQQFDNVQSIQQALKKTSIVESEQSSRKEPDGENSSLNE